uniref:Protein UBASH3A-like protein n=1 Tax=Rhabditophanes sp. KR3021 TaxID=114890 RepID=A0AC35TJH0_9BILA
MAKAFTGLRLMGMRHGERLDMQYPKWFVKLEEDKCYERPDWNMPFSLPLIRPPSEFESDTVLTLVGTMVAHLTGKGLLLSNSTPDYVYCSPALRSIQTALAVIEGSKSKATIRIEPGLFENATLYKKKRVPTFLTPDQLQGAGFDTIDYSYKPYWKITDIFGTEINEQDYLIRFHKTVSNIVNAHDGQDSSILLCGHASTCDLTVNYAYQRTKPYDVKYLLRIGDFVPYCSLVGLDQIDGKNKFVLNKKICLPITINNFTTAYDEKFVYRDVPELVKITNASCRKNDFIDNALYKD